MAKCEPKHNTVEQQGQIPRLNASFAHKQIAVATRVGGELSLFCRFLGIPFHHLNAADRLGKPGVQHAELLAQRPGDWLQLVVVASQRPGETNEKQHRHEQQLRVDGCDGNERNGQAHQRFEDQTDAWIDHRIDLLHIICRSRHNIAGALTIVEGLAFAEQTDIQFLAGIALGQLRQQLHHKTIGEVDHAEGDAHPQNDQRQRRQLFQRNAADHCIESSANQHGAPALQRRHTDHRHHESDRQPRVAHHMRPDPAHRRVMVIRVGVGDRKLFARQTTAPCALRARCAVIMKAKEYTQECG